MGPNLCNELAAAWHDRAQRAIDELDKSQEAPVFWKIERIQTLVDTANQGQVYARYWALEGME